VLLRRPRDAHPPSVRERRGRLRRGRGRLSRPENELAGAVISRRPIAITPLAVQDDV
jgi:hypothetical protein